jgi:glycosyltransferase involved in cell wall biosynthesis
LSTAPFARLWFDQKALRTILHQKQIDLLLATANFGMIKPSVPQILLNRNALYFSSEHLAELRRRREYRTLMTTLARRQMAIASIRSSTMNIVPTHAFARQIEESIGRTMTRPFEILPFGFDHDFYHHSRSLERRQSLQTRLSPKPGVRRILLVSHYNYFRNFDTLFRAMAILRQHENKLGPIELILTTQLAEGLKFHRYDTTHSARLLDQLAINDITTQLGTVSHHDLPSLYELADVVVCPSYAESFGHPMVEAMACARPIVAADRLVHREICGTAALYFSTFDAEQLAFRIAQILEDRELATSLADTGRLRAQTYSWSRHFETLTDLIDKALHPSARISTHV